MMANNAFSDVVIIKLGHPQVDINRVVNIINSFQNKYRLIYKNAIPTLGNSDLDDFAYSDNKLFNIIAPLSDINKITIGITSVPLEDN